MFVEVSVSVRTAISVDSNQLPRRVNGKHPAMAARVKNNGRVAKQTLTWADLLESWRAQENDQISFLQC